MTTDQPTDQPGPDVIAVRDPHRNAADAFQALDLAADVLRRLVSDVRRLTTERDQYRAGSRRYQDATDRLTAERDELDERATRFERERNTAIVERDQARAHGDDLDAHLVTARAALREILAVRDDPKLFAANLVEIHHIARRALGDDTDPSRWMRLEQARDAAVARGDDA